MHPIIATSRVIFSHPLSGKQKMAAMGRYLRWQIGTRLLPGPVVVPFVNNSRLVIARGMRGATEHVYTGLGEFEDCSFLLHLLRPSDLFVDVGSNVGVYTVLASACIGARSISIEPVPGTFKHLQANIAINHIESIVSAFNIGLGRSKEILRFTSDRDTMNQVVTDPNYLGKTTEVHVERIDDVLYDKSPTLIKIDVEGWEHEVLAGGTQILDSASLLGLIVEMNGLNLGSEQKVHEVLTQNGFAPYSYDPFKRALTALSSKNTDGSNTLYLRNLDEIRRRLIAAPRYSVLRYAI